MSGSHDAPYGAARDLLSWAANNWQDLQTASGWTRPFELMPARLAYGVIYTTIVSRLDETGRLKIDALLGDTDAQAELDERRRAAVVAAGGLVG